MAKTAIFFMEFWPIFDFFHRLRPYLFSKGDVLRFYKQARHRRPVDEPFFYFEVLRSKKINFCLKWSKGVQMGSKGSQMDKTLGLAILAPFWPFWTSLECWQVCHVWPFLFVLLVRFLDTLYRQHAMYIKPICSPSCPHEQRPPRVCKVQGWIRCLLRLVSTN